MIGDLPKSLVINGKEIPIRNTDYRLPLIIFEAMNDPNLSQQEKGYVMLDALIGIENITSQDAEEACKQCVWYLDGGVDYSNRRKRNDPKVMDWKQDEQMLFSAVNHVAGKELRTEKYIHWWTFLGYFNEIQDGLFSYVLNIRQKRAKHKKLDKSEKEYYKEHKDIIDIKKPETDEEKEYKKHLEELLK